MHTTTPHFFKMNCNKYQYSHRMKRRQLGTHHFITAWSSPLLPSLTVIDEELPNLEGPFCLSKTATNCRLLYVFCKIFTVHAWIPISERSYWCVNIQHHSKYKPISFAQGIFKCVIISLAYRVSMVLLVHLASFSAYLSTHLCLQTHTHPCALFMTLDWRQEKEMFAMRGNPYLNTSLHRTNRIKKLILILVVFDVLDGELPRDYTAGWITLSLAVDRIYSQVV